MRKLVMAILMGFTSAVVFSGCNTIEGIGKDVKKGGEVIEKAAEKAKN